MIFIAAQIAQVAQSIHMGSATWEIWVAIQKYSLLQCCKACKLANYNGLSKGLNF